jgi:hypothetical protein
MSESLTAQTTSRKPLRLRPGVIIAAIVVFARFVLPLAFPDLFIVGMLTAAVGVLAIGIWWVFFSRATWPDRILAVVTTIAAIFVIRPFLHPSITGGMMGMMFVAYAFPALFTPAFVLWAVATRRQSDGIRRVTMVATILVACGAWTLMRTDGIMGATGSQLQWRWTKTPEERLLAQGDDEPKPAPAVTPETRSEPAPAANDKAAPAPSIPAPKPRADSAEPKAAAGTEAAATLKAAPRAVVDAPAEWPGFRGPNRDGVVRGVQIATDWSASPPQLMWRRPIGPGWSSFSVRGDLFYTQEQRGNDEIVACYKVSTGAPVWRHRDPVRFYESNGGAGPRGTPTISRDRVYAFGATGILNALDAATGAVAWSRNVATDVKRRVPDWGFSSSPLVMDDVVIVAASGTLAAYDAETGNLRWMGPRQLGSYSSPHLATIDGVKQILLLSGSGVAAVAPSTGAVLWQYDWQEGGATIVQPAITSDGDILLNTIAMSGGTGVRRVSVAHKPEGWKVQERWTSNGLKPYFNDFVLHKGHAYGFDGNILSCIDLADGTRKWKGGRYGNGQLVLLPDQDLLLVLSEEGELALVNAVPDGFTEVARVPALEGKTWNHPVVVRDVLLVRNGEQMAAFRLSPRRP